MDKHSYSVIERMWRQIYNFFQLWNLCDFPVSSPSIDDLYCSIPIYKRHRPAGQPCKKNVWGGLNFFGNFILSTYLLLKNLIFFCHFLSKRAPCMNIFLKWFKDVYFEIASVIQLGILRRLANFTFHENYLSSQSTFGQSYMWFLQSNKQNYPWYFYNLLR